MNWRIKVNVLLFECLIFFVIYILYLQNMCHMINVNAKTPSCIYVITILNIHKIAESAMSPSFFSILFTILRSETFFLFGSRLF